MRNLHVFNRHSRPYVTLAVMCGIIALLVTGRVADAQQSSSSKTHGHEHHAPHDGTLVELGEEFAHLELVLNAQTGTLTVYVLDGEAEQSVRIAQPEIELTVHPFAPTDY
jgi:hypothetical protein